MKQQYLLVFCFIFTLITCSCNEEEKEISLKEKIGQMIMVGFADTIIYDTSTIVHDIKKYKIGGVIIYEYDVVNKMRPRNISSKVQLKKLTQQLQSHAKVPLFIGIDEEGGRVSRLKPHYGFEPTVSAEYLGSINNTDSTSFYASRIAEACKSVGINLNFAPVVDVNVNKECPVIGGIERSFSENSQEVSKHAGIYIDQHLKKQIWTSLKHFPGHGSAKNDSHKGFTDVSDTWTKKELEPYADLIRRELCPMVMTAHVFNSNLDFVYPATLSKQTLSILRDTLNYAGLILSDDMMMLAIADHFGMEEALEKSINAGIDVLLFSNNINIYDYHIVEKIVNTIYSLVQDGKITKKRIDESYNRIIAYKRKAW